MSVVLLGVSLVALSRAAGWGAAPAAVSAVGARPIEVDPARRRLTIDTGQIGADWWICLGAWCGLPAEWDRRAAEAAGR
jgi:hypothetical protein